MTKPWWDALAALCFLKHNLRHAMQGQMPTWTEQDILLTQRFETLLAAGRRLQQEGRLGWFDDSFDAPSHMVANLCGGLHVAAGVAECSVLGFGCPPANMRSPIPQERVA